MESKTNPSPRMPFTETSACSLLRSCKARTHTAKSNNKKSSCFIARIVKCTAGFLGGKNLPVLGGFAGNKNFMREFCSPF